MIISFDLDGTLTHTPVGGDYSNSVPLKERISIVNKLYDKGNIIYVETARGSKTGIDWTDLTIKQLNDWGVKYHKLLIGKKSDADLFVDDKAINAETYFKGYYEKK